MKAVAFERYGSPDVLELKGLAKPIPKAGEVLVRVHAVSVNDWDYGAMQGDSFVNRLIFGVWRPKKQVLGSDIAGRVEAVGEQVSRFKPGDEVFGDLSGRWGGFAEYACAPEKALALKSPGMSFEQAASLPQAGLLALQGLKALGPMKPGQRLLINGAGGGVGTLAIQMAKAEGLEITAVDAPGKLEMLRALGAAQVIDYTQEDFSRNGQRYDFILDVKTTRSIFDCARALRPGGSFVTLGGDTGRLVQALLLGPWFSRVHQKRVRVLALKPNHGLEELKARFESRQLSPVMDGPYPLGQMPEAFRHFGSGRHHGKVIIAVATEPPP